MSSNDISLLILARPIATLQVSNRSKNRCCLWENIIFMKNYKFNSRTEQHINRLVVMLWKMLVHLCIPINIHDQKLPDKDTLVFKKLCNLIRIDYLISP